MMHGSVNVKFPNNTSKWQMEFNSAFKGLNLNFLDFLFKKHSNFIKIRPVEAVLFHEDGHGATNSRCSQFCERTSKVMQL
jgi:hypothetical protein